MANIDTSKIEGYEEMTPEDKVKALESFNLPDPDYSGYIKKDTFDKTASELAQVKKDLKARMSEDELKEKERAEELSTDKNKRGIALIAEKTEKKVEKVIEEAAEQSEPVVKRGRRK